MSDNRHSVKYEPKGRFGSPRARSLLSTERCVRNGISGAANPAPDSTLVQSAKTRLTVHSHALVDSQLARVKPAQSSIGAKGVVDNKTPRAIGLAAHNLTAAVSNLYRLAIGVGALHFPLSPQESQISNPDSALCLKLNLRFPFQEALQGFPDGLAALCQLPLTIERHRLRFKERHQGVQVSGIERLFKQAAGLDPQNVTCFLELASLYEERKQAARSLQMRRRVRDLQPSSASSYLMIGILSAHLGHMDDAEEAFRAMGTLAPAKPEGYRELARLYLKLGKDLAQARRLSEQAVSLEASAANYFVLGWACDATGDSAMALPALRQAVALDPGNQQYVRRLHSVQRKR